MNLRNLLLFYFTFTSYFIFNTNAQCGAPTVIQSQPQSVSACEGEDVSMSVSATGENISYLWHRGGIAINGLNTPTLSLSNVRLTDAQDYFVIVTGDCGEETSNTVSLEVTESGVPSLEIINTPAICSGSSATITVTGANAGDSPIYEFKNLATDIVLQSSTSSFYTSSFSETTEIGVSMLSNSACISVGANNPVLQNTTLNVVQQPIADAGQDFSICFQNFNLSASGAGMWSTTNTAISIDEPTNPTSSVSGLVVGQSALFTWTVNDGICPSVSDDVVIDKIDEATTPAIYVNNVDVTDEEIDICASDTIQIRGTATSGFESGSWNVISGTSLSNVSGTNENLANIIPAGAGTSEISWSINPNLGSCAAEEARVTINVFAIPKGKILSVSDTEYCALYDDDLVITTESLNPGDQGIWELDDFIERSPNGDGTTEWYVSPFLANHGEQKLKFTVKNNVCEVNFYSEQVFIDRSDPKFLLDFEEESPFCVGDTINVTAVSPNSIPIPNGVFEFSGIRQTIISNSANAKIPITPASFIKDDISTGRLQVSLKSGGTKCYRSYNYEAFYDVEINELAHPFIKVHSGGNGTDTICTEDKVTLLGEKNLWIQFPTEGKWFKDGAPYANGQDSIYKDIDSEWDPTHWLRMRKLTITEPGAYTFEKSTSVCKRYTDTIYVGFEEPIIDFPNAVNGTIETVSSENIPLEANNTGEMSQWFSKSGNLIFNDPNNTSTNADLTGTSDYAFFKATSGGCTSEDSVFVKINATGLDAVVYQSFDSFLSFEEFGSYQEAHLTIYDLKGILKSRVVLSGNETWNTSSLLPGTYVYRIKFGDEIDQIKTGKLLILD